MSNIDWKKEIMTIPNLLSIFRLVLIPVYVSIYLNATENWQYYLAAGILAVSCITDCLDGFIARRFNMISNLGKLLDPVADKATQFALIICLAFRYPLMFLMIALFVVKEGFQLIAMTVNLRKGKAMDGALMSGKVCTTFLFTTLTFMVMLPDIPENIVNLMIWIDIVFLVIAFGDYIMAFCVNDSMISDLKLKTKDAENPEE